MKSVRARLEVGKEYILHSVGSYETRFVCVRRLMVDDYSAHNAELRNIWSGWTFTAHGVNIYEDGTIDWDFSTNGRFEK